MRLKNRYFLVELESANTKSLTTVNERAIAIALKDGVLKYHGDCGMGMIAPTLQVKYYNPATRFCIIRVGRDHRSKLEAVMSRLSTVANTSARFKVIHVSGTVRLCQMRVLELNRKAVLSEVAQAEEAMKLGELEV